MYDLIIKNGKIIDGTGNPFFWADIAIKDGKIAGIAKRGKLCGEAKRIIDASGLTVTPGFIDSHSHSDSAIIDCRDMTEKIEQGITTSVSGQCGTSVVPKTTSSDKDVYLDDIGMLSEVRKDFASFKNATQNLALGSNNICLIGHGTLRVHVMGMKKDEPNAEEMERMKAFVRNAMENNAIGISFGLIYPPSSYAKTEELIELAKVVGEYGGIVAAHIRSEGDFLVGAVKEFIEVIRASGARGVLSHHKSCGAPENWGKVSHTLRMIDEANEEGLEVYLDVYPYIASHTSASVTFVPDSGRDLLKRLESPEERELIREWNLQKWWGNDYSWVQIMRCTAYPEYEGLFIPQAAKLHGKDQFNTLMDMICDSQNKCSCCYFTMCEEDVHTVIKHPRAMVCTDSGVSYGKTVFHPRLKGTFPRMLGRYVREDNTVTLTEMIRKMTSMPAFVYGLKTKGLLREGMDADICIFDAEKIIDRSSFTNPNQRAEGLNYVILGGEVVVEDAVFNGKRMGKVIF